MKLFKNNSTCNKCKMLTMLLNNANKELIDYEIIDTDTDVGMAEAISLGVRSLPSIYVNGEVIAVEPTEETIEKYFVKG